MKSPRKRAKLVSESDLYTPVRDYLAAQGYTVRGEVRHCDVVAVKDQDVIVVELKRTLNLALLAQAVQRQQITDSVYVAVPRPSNKRRWNAESRGLQRLLRRLELGLILVSVKAGKPAVEIIFHPIPCEHRKRSRTKRAVIEEVERRSGDYNLGGSSRRKLVTAYRENAIQIAAYLAELGPLSPARLREMGTGPKTHTIVYRNVYSWFERVNRGVYALSPKGKKELAQYPELVEMYRETLSAEVTPPSATPLQR